MLRADIRCKDGRADDEPAEVAAREEVVVGRILISPDHPPSDPEQQREIQSNEDPIEAGHMRDPISRRDWLMAMGAGGAGAMLPTTVPGPTSLALLPPRPP